MFLCVEQLCPAGHQLSLGFKEEDAPVALLTTVWEVAFLPYLLCLEAVVVFLFHVLAPRLTVIFVLSAF